MCAPFHGKMHHKQGQIHGRTVADGWTGAVMQKPLAIQKCDGPTDGPTDRHGKVQSRVSATKNDNDIDISLVVRVEKCINLTTGFEHVDRGQVRLLL